MIIYIAASITVYMYSIACTEFTAHQLPLQSLSVRLVSSVWVYCTAAFADETYLEKNATDPKIGQMYFAGIVFINPFPDPNSLPKNITYKIRPKAEPYNKSSAGVDDAKRFSWFTNIMYPSRSRPREPEKTRFGGIPPGNFFIHCSSTRLGLALI